VNGRLSRTDGLLLTTLLLVYSGLLAYLGRKQPAQLALGGSAPPRTAAGWMTNLALVGGGLAMLLWGSRWLVAGALAIAKSLGVSELIIGLTIVAAGTSLPEVATSVIAAVRGQRDIAVGNVVGSCIFNILAVLGIASVAAPHGIAMPRSALGFDIPIMIVVSVAAWPIVWSGAIISRREGIVFLFYYLAYTSYLILYATQHDRLPLFNTVLVYFVIPVTLATALLAGIRSRRDDYLRQLQRPRGHW
jgi:cation:H+ antiporter